MIPMRTRRFLLLLVAMAVTFGALSRAAGPVYWTTASHADFLKGTVVGVSVDATGRLTPAPSVTTVQDVAAPQLWSLVAMPDGWAAGTGGDGRVVRWRAGAMSTVLDVDAANVHALAVSGGRLFAGSSPEGAVHVIEPDGTSRVFFDPAEPHIWALALDATGQLWVATGHPATVYRVAPDGTATTMLRAPARHAMALTVDSTGRVFAGTDSPARLYRFGADGRAFAVFEAPQVEMRVVRAAPDGGIFVATLAATEGAAPEAAVTSVVTVTVGSQQASTSSTSPSAGTAPRSTVFHVDASGVWDQVWQSSDLIYDMAVVDATTVLAGTGPNGRLYEVTRDGRVTLVNTVDALQATRLIRDDARTLIATANPGRVLALGATATATAGTYTSDVRDGTQLAQWGSIRWDGNGAITLQTRSGNTSTPDDTWSAWSAPLASPGAITSPASRFLQWRATLPTAAGVVLTSVTASYLPRNQRPEITEVTTQPPGVVFQKPFSSDEGAVAGLDERIAVTRRPPGGEPPTPPTLGRRMFQRGLQTIQWKAEDADDDPLTFALDYRREGDAVWLPLRSDLTDALFVWDTTSVPDGRYLVRISAHDGLGNTTDRRLVGLRESLPIDIDNTPADIVITVTGTRLSITARDAFSGIRQIEISRPGQPWITLAPEDGVADSREERAVLTVSTPAEVAGVVVRVTDVMGNVRTASAGSGLTSPLR
jgi:sugar lactone lactonase YvrE